MSILPDKIIKERIESNREKLILDAKGQLNP